MKRKQISKENLTIKELALKKNNMFEGLELPCTIDGVHFSKFLSLNTIRFSYKNSRGLIHADNGYNGKTEDGKDYYFLWKLSCAHTQDLKYNPSFAPNLRCAAGEIIKSWNSFCNN